MNPSISLPEFLVELADVTEVASDLLLLKHAQAFHGADRAVASVLVAKELCQEGQLRVAPGAFEVVETCGAIASARVMFLGTAPLYSFGYDEMRQFAFRSVAAVKTLATPIRVLTTTVHDAGYGLDSVESRSSWSAASWRDSTGGILWRLSGSSL